MTEITSFAELGKADEKLMKLLRPLVGHIPEAVKLIAEIVTNLDDFEASVKKSEAQAQQDLDNAKWCEDYRPIYTHIQVCGYRLNDIRKILGGSETPQQGGRD